MTDATLQKLFTNLSRYKTFACKMCYQGINIMVKPICLKSFQNVQQYSFIYANQ